MESLTALTALRMLWFEDCGQYAALSITLQPFLYSIQGHKRLIQSQRSHRYNVPL